MLIVNRAVCGMVNDLLFYVFEHNGENYLTIINCLYTIMVVGVLLALILLMSFNIIELDDGWIATVRRYRSVWLKNN
jgi:hypothetical protein